MHKAILCIRSEWFKKALTGKYKVSANLYIPHSAITNDSAQEAKEGIINIKDFKENEVDCLLNYIYTGSKTFNMKQL